MMDMKQAVVTKTRLLRNGSDLPSWFPLAIYSKDLTAGQWLDALVMRFGLQTALNNTQDVSRAKQNFDDLIVRRALSDQEIAASYFSHKAVPRVPLGVMELPARDAAHIAAMFGRSKRGRQLVTEIAAITANHDSDSLYVHPSARVERAGHQSFSDLVNHSSERYRLPDVLSGVPVSVDITQDDESLMLAFKIWLAGARSILGPAPKPYQTKDYADWRGFGVLSAFDLKLWGSLHGVRFSDSLVANAIWPDAECDNVERLRKVTRRKIAELLNDWAPLGRLWRQLELESALDRVVLGGLPPPRRVGHAA